MVFTIPDQYGYVLLAGTGTCFVNLVHFVITVGARKEAGIKYPTAYASEELAAKDKKAARFNCAQRAHANFTEGHLSFLAPLLISGLRYPVMAASLGGVWTFARVWYAFGYTSSKGPAGRVGGSALSMLMDLSVKVMAVFTSYTLASGSGL